jgi:seryl-tRNA synthetase
MIDIKILRNDPQCIKDNLARRGDTEIDVDALHALDKEYVDLIQVVENQRAEMNQLKDKCQDNLDAREQMKMLKQAEKVNDNRLKDLKVELDEKLSWLPNLLSDDVPDGKDDTDNYEIKVVGDIPQYDFEPRDHQELGEILDIIDTQRGAKVAQAGFYYWKGKGAMLTQALFFWTQQEMMKRGYTVMMSPCVAKSETLFGTGYLPFFADQSYKLEGEDLSLIGTSEQTLVGYHAKEILDLGDDNPSIKLTAYTPCFRTESGSYGKATRGIHRVHQFHKVEQIVFCRPEDTVRYHDFCQETAEHLAAELGLPYHVVNVCVGDMGAPGHKKYDIEAWFPGYNGYREITSNTNLTDFQSRRLGIRYKDTEGRNQFVHTISSTAVTDRVVCSIIENYQEADGSVRVPEVLQGLCGFDRIEPAK